MRNTSIFLLLSASLLLWACPPVDDESCLASDAPSINLGQGVGSAFEAFVDDQQVGLSVAPQGGFGVSTRIATMGLRAGENEYVDVLMETRIDDDVTGSFLLEAARLLCRGDGLGGLITSVVVGFDPDIYRTNDDLLALDGSSVVLDVTVTGADDTSAEFQQPLVVVVGG